MNSIVLSLFGSALIALSASAATPGEPPVPSPFGPKLDNAATGKWWEVAEKTRKAKASPKNRNVQMTATGRRFLDLDVPRDEVVGFAMYTVHEKTLRMSAQLYPLYPDETREIRLEVKQGNTWKEIARQNVNDIGWSTTFEIKNWDDSRDAPYRVRHGKTAQFEGLIRKNPTDKDELVVANLSCNSSRNRGARTGIINNLKAQDPDILFFAGDQHYDHTQHTAGWLLFGHQFREVIKDRPTICIPDDHDIGQPNLWGEGGIKGDGNGNGGGYIYHPEYVKMVERCQTANLPVPYDPSPIAQGMTVYYTDYTWGDVSFAILEDRKFKTGPRGKIPQQGPRPDHIRNPEYDPESIDLPHLVLLGQRQLDFLADWVDNWEGGVKMKAVLSQTPFCGAAHYHGGGSEKNRLHADLDSNGWPQTGREKALRIIRKAFAVHLAGDQHLSTTLQHGIDEFRDGPFSFVSPAIHNTIYGRYWHPEGEKVGANPIKGDLPWTGDYLDGFNNKVTMHAYANPDTDPGNGTSGHQIVTFNKKDRTITAASWAANVDPSKPGAKPFPGWPITVNQQDNFNPPSWGTLPEQKVSGKNAPVVQVIDEKSGKALYTVRAKGTSFTLRAPKGGSYTVKAGDDAPGKVVAKGLKAK